MDGVLYVTDENNNNRYIQIDLLKHGAIVEDILDRLTIQMRKNEKSYPLNDIINELKEDGDLDKYV